MNFLGKVFGLMSLGILITALTAFYSAMYLELNWMMFGLVFLAELVLIYFISKNGTPLHFFLFAILNGYILSSIILYYDMSELAMAFVTTSAFFGVLSFIGLTTNRDLSSWGTILFAGLIALIVMIVANIFIGGTQFALLISALAIVIFGALTIYNVNDIKKQKESQHAVTNGALSLYLNFVNIFIHMLRLMFLRK